MTTLHYVDANGVYLGGFGDGAVPPGGSIEVTAPPDGRMVWNGSAWTAPQTMLADYAAQKRRALENGSAIIDIGETSIPVWVDPISRGSILGLAFAAFGPVPNITTMWKGSDGQFYELTTAEIMALALGMMAYVQECFAVEAAVLLDIGDDTITTTAQIDAADWPG